jgi:hypothetical protein
MKPAKPISTLALLIFSVSGIAYPQKQDISVYKQQLERTTRYSRHKISFCYPSSFEITEDKGNVGGGSISFHNPQHSYDRLFVMWLPYVPTTPDYQDNTAGPDLFLYKFLSDWASKNRTEILDGDRDGFVIPNVAEQKTFVSPMRHVMIAGLAVSERIVCVTQENRCYLYFYGCFRCGNGNNSQENIFVVSFNSLIILSSDPNLNEYVLNYERAYNLFLCTTFENVIQSFKTTR